MTGTTGKPTVALAGSVSLTIRVICKLSLNTVLNKMLKIPLGAYKTHDASDGISTNLSNDKYNNYHWKRLQICFKRAATTGM